MLHKEKIYKFQLKIFGIDYYLMKLFLIHFRIRKFAKNDNLSFHKNFIGHTNKGFLSLRIEAFQKPFQK